MNYPVWDAGLGYGVLMAAIAVVHVFVSHFAIGGGLYLVVHEQMARRKGDAGRLEFLERMTKFFVLVTLVFGALTGVGIWFVIGLLSPAATELLIHNFVWGWAIEWTFFVVEILAALLYFYGWRRMAPRAHLALGWIYFVAAYLSLVVINGILAFMLTPGNWLVSGDFWDGFFNPTYWPMLTLRTGVCLMLAGLYALLVASRLPANRVKQELARTNSIWALAGLGLAMAGFAWYQHALPAALLATARQNMPWVMAWQARVGLLALALAAAILLLGLFAGRRLHFVGAAVLMLLGFAWFGSYEFLRESIRKPWIVSGYMYGNSVEAAALPRLQSEGLLAHVRFRSGDDGRDLFLHSCRSCHSLRGYKALAPAFDGTDVTFISGAIRGVHRMRGNMPPFAGNRKEAEQLAGWIAGQVDSRSLAAASGLSGAALGGRSFAVRCGPCHVPGGYQDPLPTLAGLDAEGLSEFLDTAGEIAEEMPPFTGDAVERTALVGHLLVLQQGGAK